MPVLKALVVALTTIFLLALSAMAQTPEDAAVVPMPACPPADAVQTDASGLPSRQGLDRTQFGPGECNANQAEEPDGVLDGLTDALEDVAPV